MPRGSDGTELAFAGVVSSNLVAPAHALDADAVARGLDTDPMRGLAPDGARARLAELGPNELTEEPPAPVVPPSSVVAPAPPSSAGPPPAGPTRDETALPGVAP